MAGTVQPAERRGPPDRHLVTVVALSLVGSGVAGQPVGALEQQPWSGGIAVRETVLVIDLLQLHRSVELR